VRILRSIQLSERIFENTYDLISKSINSALTDLSNKSLINLQQLLNPLETIIDNCSLNWLRLFSILKMDVERVVNYMAQKQIDPNAFFDYLINAFELLVSRNIQVVYIHVDLSEDEEDIDWKVIDVTIKVKSEDYDSLLSIWIELARMKPRAWKNVYVGVEPL